MHECWLVKTDSQGYMEWNRTYGGSREYVAKNLVQTSDGGYTLAGHTGLMVSRAAWMANVDPVGNMNWDVTWYIKQTTQTSCLIKTRDGGYAITGWAYSLFFPSAGADVFPTCFFIVGTDFNGNIQWNSTYGGLGDNNALFAVQTDNGGYVLAGSTKSLDEGAHYDIWFAKVDASSDLIPEFPSWILLMIMLFVVMSLAFIYRSNMNTPDREKRNH